MLFPQLLLVLWHSSLGARVENYSFLFWRKPEETHRNENGKLFSFTSDNCYLVYLETRDGDKIKHKLDVDDKHEKGNPLLFGFFSQATNSTTCDKQSFVVVSTVEKYCDNTRNVISTFQQSNNLIQQLDDGIPVSCQLANNLQLLSSAIAHSFVGKRMPQWLVTEHSSSIHLNPRHTTATTHTHTTTRYKIQDYL